jgi:hypothetical protein
LIGKIGWLYHSFNHLLAVLLIDCKPNQTKPNQTKQNKTKQQQKNNIT